MSSKQELVALIKEWIGCDNKLKQLQKTAKEFAMRKSFDRIFSRCYER